MNKTRPFTFKKEDEDGFTLTELLVVIVTVAVLGVLLLPALASTKPNSQAFQCLENLRQLTLGWQMYAQDNNGKLPPNGSQATQCPTPTDPRYLPGGAYSQWCPGVVSTVIDNINGDFIKAGLIYSYVNNTNLYRCPADLKTFARMGINYPQVRSYAMNCCVAPINPFAMVNWNSPPARTYYKDTDFTQPGPSMTFVFIDENEISITDTLFCDSPIQPNWWQNAPATRHAGAGSLSFADGHSEMKRWTDKYLLQIPTIFSPGQGHPSDPNSGDNAWLLQRVTVLQ